jgi:hypothetical protein
MLMYFRNHQVLYVEIVDDFSYERVVERATIRDTITCASRTSVDYESLRGCPRQYQSTMDASSLFKEYGNVSVL